MTDRESMEHVLDLLCAIRGHETVIVKLETIQWARDRIATLTADRDALRAEVEGLRIALGPKPPYGDDDIDYMYVGMCVSKTDRTKFSKGDCSDLCLQAFSGIDQQRFQAGGGLSPESADLEILRLRDQVERLHALRDAAVEWESETTNPQRAASRNLIAAVRALDAKGGSNAKE